MIELAEKQIEKIKNAVEIDAIEHIINNYILELKSTGAENYFIANRIRRLDVSLLLIDKKGLSGKEQDNIKFAQKVLINKIVHGNLPDFVKK
jgi:hypothetical protein